MYRKTSVFASGSPDIAPKSDADYRQGMIPNTVAMAEDVNAYGLKSDEMNWTMSQEISNLLEAYGITLGSARVADPTNPANKMLLKLFREKLTVGTYLTGVGGSIPVITQSGNALNIPELQIRFNTSVYYGGTEDEMPVITIPAQTLSATGSWADGVYYVYATSAGAIATQTSPVLGSDGATKCMLGSVFVYNGAFQANSWKYQPWLQISAVEDRETPTAYIKGGYITPASSSTLQIGSLEIQAEGFGIDYSVTTPNTKTVISGTTPFTYKALYSGYNPGSSDLSTIGGNDSGDVGSHLYDMTDNSWVDAVAYADQSVTSKYMVIVPCITPAGQTLMIPAMSEKDGNGNYTSVFDSAQEAEDAIFGLQYEGLDSVAARVIYLGMSLVIRIPKTGEPLDLMNRDDLRVIGRVPQALEGFTSGAGQSGGGTGAYVPMKKYFFNNTFTSVTPYNNAANEIEGNDTTAVAVTFPTPTAGIINQVLIHYSHTSTKQGLSFANVKWWFERVPVFQDGYTYEIIAEYVDGYWRLGYIEGLS